MAVSNDRKYTREYVFNLLEGIKGKTLGEIDKHKSHQFERTQNNKKITGIAGDVIEQSVFGYDRDSKQECDIEIDGILTELKTTGVRVPKSELKNIKNKTGTAYNVYLRAKEGISITGVTFEPDLQRDFLTSHFWEKSEHLLIVFYEYKSYDVVPASQYAEFPIVDYCYNLFSDEERGKLQNDWEIVRDYLQNIYAKYPTQQERNEHLQGFTHVLRPNLLLIELVPGFKKKDSGNYQKPRYRLKQTFIDYIVRGHFNGSRADLEDKLKQPSSLKLVSNNKKIAVTEVNLKEPFSSFSQLDERCHAITEKYKGKNFVQLKKELGVDTEMSTKDFGAKCVLKMFDADCNRLNQISDFTKTGIIAKTITVTPSGGRTEDMKLKRIDFDEWADKDLDFEESEVHTYFSEHSFLCPIFCERGDMRPRNSSESQEAYKNRLLKEIQKTTFEGFKRFSFDEEFIEKEVKRTWEDSRSLIHHNKLEWKYVYDQQGNKCKNKNGSYRGAPNFPKSSEYLVFFRGGAVVSTETSRKEKVNGIKMLPQFFWLKGSYIASKLQTLSYL